MEHHPHLCPTDDPRGAAHDRLSELGYEVADRAPGVPPDDPILWAWLPDAVPGTVPPRREGTSPS
jgi:hypothetical protein